MTALRIPDPPPESKARALRLYLETDTATDDIAKLLNYTPRTFRSRIHEWNWPVRLRRRKRPILTDDVASDVVMDAALNEGAGAEVSGVVPPGPAPCTPVTAVQGAANLASLALRLERLVARRIDQLEAEALAGRDRDPDGTDRRLVQLERLLAQLAKRRGLDHPDDGEPPARSVAELRDALLDHLDRVRLATRRPRTTGPAPDSAPAD